MTADQLWPAEARAAVHEVLLDTGSPWVGREALTDAVLAALSAHAVPRTAYERRCDELDAAGMAIAAAHSRLHRAVLDLARHWEVMPDLYDGNLCASELRALAGGDQ